MHVISNSRMNETAKLSSNVARRLISLTLRQQLSRTHNNVYDFSTHVINDLEFQWATDYSENHLLFLKELHAQQLKGTSAWDPLNIEVMDENRTIHQTFSAVMKRLHIARLAKVVLTKKKFRGIHDGTQVISFDGVGVSSSQRLRSGWYYILY